MNHTVAHLAKEKTARRSAGPSENDPTRNQPEHSQRRRLLEMILQSEATRTENEETLPE